MKPAVVLKKIRSLRVVAGALFSLLMIFSFQNCAPQQNCAASSADCSAKDSKTTNTGTRPSNNTISLGSSGSSSGGSSSGSGNTISIGGGSGGSGGGSSGSGWSNSGGSGTGSSGSGPLQFTAQPSGVSVIEQANFQLSASVGGGTYPYTYLWYKDGVAISDGTGNYSIYKIGRAHV